MALYKGNLNYDEFRDSCKIREYQALGTIPLTSRVVKANTQEIKKYNSGILINNEEDIKKVLKKVFCNNKYKKELANNSKYNNNLYKNKFQNFYDLIKNL